MSEVPEQEDYSSLSIEERLTHKVWKVRLNAYEESTRAFSSSPDESALCFRPYNSDPDLLVKAVRDANVVAQEAGVGLLLAYLEFAGAQNALRTRANVLPAMVEKCLGSTRAGTKTKAIDACLMYVELDSGEPVIEDLIPGLSNKLPKLVAATAMTIKKIYQVYGAKAVKAKPAVQVLPKLFSHADKNVRAEAIELAIILYKWLGDAIKPMLLADLKPVQVKELETAFEGITAGEVKQERLLRSQQAAQAAAAENGADAEEEVPPEEPVDAFDLAEPVDVLSSMPANFEEMMSSSKWKDRKEVLEALTTASNVPRIKEADYGDVSRTLGKCVQKDANVMCVALAANCIENLAKGLKRSFGKYRNVLFTPCGERYKEKKQNVIDAVSAALDALFLSTTLEDVIEETLTLIKNKNPSVRQQTLLFLARALSVTATIPRKEEVKALAEGSAALIGDTDAKVRDASAEVLGVLMKLVGERAMGPYLESVDDIKRAKIMEFFGSATTKAKAEKPKPIVAPTVKAPVKKPPTVKKAPIGTIPSSPVKKKVVGSGYGIVRPAPGTKPTSKLVRPSEAGLRPESPSAAPRLSRPVGNLSRPTAQSLTRPTTNSLSQEPSLSAADRMDLEQLRREKNEWLASAVEREEVAKMKSQIHELQIKVCNDMLLC